MSETVLDMASASMTARGARENRITCECFGCCINCNNNLPLIGEIIVRGSREKAKRISLCVRRLNYSLNERSYIVPRSQELEHIGPLSERIYIN